MERMTPTKEWREAEEVGYAVYLEEDLCKAYDERLSGIEDILGDHYDLDRLRELVNAQNEGRLVELPCKEGDTVYRLEHVLTAGCSGARVGVVKCAFSWLMIPELGETVFLTRAEAEAALNGGGGDDSV